MQISRRWLLGGAGLAVLGAAGFAPGGRTLFYAAITEEVLGTQLSVAEAYQATQSGEIILIDIRRPDEWDRTGIAQGAVPLDMRRADFTEALLQITGGADEARVALICARGVRSARLTNRLTEAGFHNIIDVPEGMLGSPAGPGWIAAGLPLDQI